MAPLRDVTDSDQVAAYFAKARPIADKQVTELKALHPAAEAQADYDDFVTRTERATDLLGDVYEQAKAGHDEQAAQLLRRLAAAISATDGAAAKLGLQRCGGS